MREVRTTLKRVRLPMVLASLAFLSLCLLGVMAYATELPSGTPLYSEHIVNGVSPSGTTIDLFDYWITEQTETDVTDPDDINQGINENHALMFSSANGARKDEWNKWTGTRTPFPRIVQDKLGNDGYPALNNLTSVEITSADSNESLAYLFDPNVTSAGKASYEDVQGLLRVDSDGYYYYNSTKNYAVYYADSNSFTLYDYPGVISGGASKVNGQFFPFNEATSDPDGWDGLYYNSGLMNTTYSNDGSINHYFGLHMSTRFIQQNGGYTDTNKMTPVTYEFSGDDDIWIFIDGQLVADLGGIHDAASVKIDFSTGEITINGVVQSQKLGSLLGYDSDTLPDNTYHTLDFFYLERGGTDSNMNLKYNLVTIPESDLIKIDQLGDPVPGATFALYAAGDRNTPIATGTTDGSGEFVFLDDKGMPITLQALYEAYDSVGTDEESDLVLVETYTPPGYRSNGDIGLYFYVTEGDEVLLLCNNTWETGTYAMPKVTATAPNVIRSADEPTKQVVLSGTNAVENPLMFAVVYQKQADGTWRPVSGDPVSGWKVWAGNDWNSVISAAQASPYLFNIASSGAYQVEINNLPGDIKDYYYICKDEGKAQYTIGYYYTTATSLSQATKENTWRIDSDPTDEDASTYALDRVFSMDLYVPNVKNRLLVQKVDEDDATVNGATFSLYEKGDVTVNPDGTATVNSGATPYDTLTTASISEILNLDGGGIFPTSGHVLERGEYYLIETSAPKGYKLNDTAVHIVVDNTGVYADAGTSKDGISVLRGVGSVLRSAVQFAVDDGVDTTLQGIKAALSANVTYENGSFAWDEADWDTGTVLHLQYANKNSMLDYGLYDTSALGTIDNLTLATEEGWSKLLIRQCFKHDDSVNASLKSDLGDTDITSLFSGTVTVRVSNDKTGDLRIRKTVTGDGAPESNEFTFTVTVTDGSAPLNGTYGTTGSNGDTDEIEFLNGTATVTLKANESLTILGLPTGASWTVVEEPAGGYATSVSVTGDAKSAISGSTAFGTIGHTPDGGAPIEVSYTNVWSGLSVSKTVTGSMGDRDRAFSFTIKLTDKDEKPLTGSYSYVGGTLSGTTGVDAPQDGALELNGDGEATFSLKHGQVITIYGLPQGCSYTITESIDSGEGYKTTVQTGSDGAKNGTTATGTLTGSVSVAFTNALSSAPVTGVSIDTLPWIAASGLTAAGGAALLLSARKHRAGRHFARGKGRGSRR